MAYRIVQLVTVCRLSYLHGFLVSMLIMLLFAVLVTVLCCKECATGIQHTGHAMISCADEHCIGAISDAVWERLTGLEAKIDKGPSQRNDIAMIKKELNRACEETCRQIEDRFNNLHLILSEREMALKEEVAATVARLLNKLTIQEKACTAALDDAKFALLHAHRFVQFRDPAFSQASEPAAAAAAAAPAPVTTDATAKQPQEPSAEKASNASSKTEDPTKKPTADSAKKTQNEADPSAAKTTQAESTKSTEPVKKQTPEADAATATAA